MSNTSRKAFEEILKALDFPVITTASESSDVCIANATVNNTYIDNRVAKRIRGMKLAKRKAYKTINKLQYIKSIDGNEKISFPTVLNKKYRNKNITTNNKTSMHINQEAAYLNIEINIKEDLEARMLGNYILGLLDVYQDFQKILLTNFDEPKLKINIQSPGYLKFLGKPFTIMLLAVVFIGICGGRLKLNVNENVLDMETEGLIKKIADAYVEIQNSEHYKALKELNKKLNVVNPVQHN